MIGGWPLCDRCGKQKLWLSTGSFVCSDRDCSPKGMVKCPADHHVYPNCPMCKNTGFVEELT